MEAKSLHGRNLITTAPSWVHFNNFKSGSTAHENEWREITARERLLGWRRNAGLTRLAGHLLLGNMSIHMWSETYFFALTNN